MPQRDRVPANPTDGRLPSGSGVTGAANGGTNLSIEFGTGTRLQREGARFRFHGGTATVHKRS